LDAFLIFPLCTTCLAHLIFLDLITLIIFNEESKLWSSSLCSFLHLPAIASLLALNMFSALYSHIHSVFALLFYGMIILKYAVS
jgi:hypothetical protein